MPKQDAMADQGKHRPDGVAPNPLAGNPGAAISFGSFGLDVERRLLLKGDEPVRIGSRALEILIALIDRAGEIVSRYELLEAVWPGATVDESVVRVHMSALKRALGDGSGGARYIVNVAGRGYSFVAPVARNAQAAPPAPAESRSSPSLAATPRLRTGSIIGRNNVVRSLGELILTRRFVSIVGAGGIGKTTVAAAIAQNLQTELGDENIAFVDLGAISDPELVPGAVNSAVGCKVGGADPLSDLLSFVADRRMLIIFDSCEHLVDAVSPLAERIFQHAPTVHLLLTSRESLRVEGETVHLLTPLTYPLGEHPTATEALETSAVQLFMERAVSSGFTGELSDADAPIVSEICRRAGGIALAIELAASRVGAHGIRGVADLLSGDVELRLAGRRNVVPRHRTLAAMLDWSFRLLSKEEQRILCRLSVFVGPFTIEAACSATADAEHGTAAVAAAVTGLVDKSLIWVDVAGRSSFYRLLDTTRAYAADKLKQIEEPTLIARRHLRYFADLFKATALEPGAYSDLERHAPHVGNIRKALDWGFADDESRAVAAELAADVAPLFLGLWLLVECRHWSRLALATTDGIGDRPRREARLLEALAVSTMHTRGNTREVRDAIERGLNLSASEGGGFAQYRLLAGLNLFLTRLGDFDGALAAARRCRAIASEVDSPVDNVIAEWLLAAAYHMAGDQAAAVDHCERGFRLEAEIGRLEINLFGYDHHLRAELALARSLWLTGFPTRACRLVLDALGSAARSSVPGDYGMAAAHGIPVLLWGGETQQSGEHIERLIAHAERHSLAGHAAFARSLKGERLLLTGEISAGVETLERALKDLQKEQFRMLIPAAYRALADGLARCGSHAEAMMAIDTAISSVSEMGARFWLPDLLRTRGEALLKRPSPDHDEVESTLRKSIELARDQAAVGWELKAAVPLAQMLARRNRVAEALGVLEPIHAAHPEKSGTKDLDDAESLLASLR